MLARVLAIFALSALMSCAAEAAPNVTEVSAASLASASPDPFRLGAPIAVPALSWQYVEFPHAVCMDGQTTGLALNVNPQSNRLIIYFEPPNSVALSAVTALLTPRSWGPADMDPHPTGVLDRDNSDNPFRNWNMVFIPACSGDLGTGATASGYAGAPQLGASNYTEYLARLVPTFTHVSRVVLSGSSGGALGAAFHWRRTQEVFGSAPVDLLSDSGLPLGPDFIAACAQKRAIETWNWRASVDPSCSECDLQSGNVLQPLLHTTLAQLGPKARARFLSYDEDATMRTFFAIGSDDCAHIDDLIPPQYPTGKFPMGIAQLQAELAPYPNIAFFIAPGEQHTFLQGSLQEAAHGVKLSDWLREFADAEAM